MKLKLLPVLLLSMCWMACEDGTELSRADNLYNKGSYKEAIAAYTKFIDLHPDHTKALYNRGRTFEETGEVDKALEDFDRVLKIDFTHVQANVSMAMDMYFRKKDYPKSIAFLNTSIKYNPQNAYAFTLRGKAYQKLGEVDQALKDYNNALSIDSEFNDAYYSRGSLYMHMKNTDKACNDFEIAESLGNKEAEAAKKQFCK